MDRRIVRAKGPRIGLAMVMWLAVVTPLYAQAPEAARSSFSVLLGGGWTTFSGEPSAGGVVGVTLAGAAYQRQVVDRISVRTELVGWLTRADLGRTGLFEQSTTVGQNHLGVGLQIRGAVGRNGFVGIGGTLLAETVCDVDLEGGPGFFGGETVPCEEFEEGPFMPRSSAAALLASAGVEFGRWGLEARFDQGLGASLEGPAGRMVPRRISLILHYVLRRWA